MFGAKESFVAIGGEKLRYITFGRGSTPLLMLQGLSTRSIKGSGSALALAYRCFAKNFTVYLFDRREDIPAGITTADLAADVIAAMDALGLRDAMVLGVSQGGMIAQHIAAERPDLVNKLVLAFTCCRSNPTLTAAVNRWVALTEAKQYRALIRDMAERLYSKAYLRIYRPFLPFLTLLQTPKDPERFINLAKSCLEPGTAALLSAISCPCLVIGAEEDRIVGAAASKELAEALGCEVYLYPGLGHAAYEEKAADFNARMLSFFKN